jgi:hypothetical protein
MSSAILTWAFLAPGQKRASRRPQRTRHSAQHLLVCAAHAAQHAAEQPAEHNSLSYQLCSPAAKIEWQKTSTLQHPYVYDGSHVGWFHSHALAQVASTYGRTSEHACPSCCSPRPAVACSCLLLLVCALVARPRHVARLRLLACYAPSPVGTACAS